MGGVAGSGPIDLLDTKLPAAFVPSVSALQTENDELRRTLTGERSRWTARARAVEHYLLTVTDDTPLDQVRADVRALLYPQPK